MTVSFIRLKQTIACMSAKGTGKVGDSHNNSMHEWFTDKGAGKVGYALPLLIICVLQLTLITSRIHSTPVSRPQTVPFRRSIQVMSWLAGIRDHISNKSV